MWKLETVISVDILMAKVNWETFFKEEMVFLCVCMCVYSGDIFYSCEIAPSQLSRGHCFRTSRCQSTVARSF